MRWEWMDLRSATIDELLSAPWPPAGWKFHPEEAMHIFYDRACPYCRAARGRRLLAFWRAIAVGGDGPARSHEVRGATAAEPTESSERAYLPSRRLGVHEE